MWKQGLYIGTKQLEKRGGVGGVAQSVGGWMVERVMHPVQSVGMAWDGLVWGVGAVQDGIGFATRHIGSNTGGGQGERDVFR